MVSQKELARRFARGDPVDAIPAASNMNVVTADDDGFDALIVGYNWAVYAARQNGTVTVFDGWHGYSPSTSCQITEIRKGVDEAAAELEESDKMPPYRTHGWRANRTDVTEKIR